MKIWGKTLGPLQLHVDDLAFKAPRRNTIKYFMCMQKLSLDFGLCLVAKGQDGEHRGTRGLKDGWGWSWQSGCE